MNLSNNVSLKDKTTIRTPASAETFLTVNSMEDIQQAINQGLTKQTPLYILGEGSNTLFTKDFNGLIIHPQLLGKETIDETDETITLKIGASQSWPKLVEYAVNLGWIGIENLALIPGTVGAAPIQNIAAYGQSQHNSFVKLEAINLANGEVETYQKKDCHFAYRDSIFKHQGDKRLITSVTYQLDKIGKLNTDYFSIGRRRDSVTKELQKIAKKPYQVKDVYQAVANIRSRKLPDWNQTPTFGSFFKNPLVTKKKLHKLQQEIPDLQFYPPDNLTYKQQNDVSFNQSNHVKIPVGRLLDHLGWAEKQIGHVHTYNNWASVVTHDGQASGQEVLEYLEAMRQSVLHAFGIQLDHEVNVI